MSPYVPYFSLQVRLTLDGSTLSTSAKPFTYHNAATPAGGLAFSASLIAVARFLMFVLTYCAFVSRRQNVSAELFRT